MRTPVAELVPEFAAEGKDKVTVGHLLTHTGGLNGGLFPVPAATQGDLSVVVEAACRATPSAPPGERVSYSSTLAHAVLAEAVRRCDAGDARFRDILAAGGLRAAGYARQRARDARGPGRPCGAGRRARPGHRGRSILTSLKNWGPKSLTSRRTRKFPGAGVVATAADVFAFIEALRRGGSLESGRILSPATVAFAAQNQTGDKPNDLWGLARELYGWPLCPAYLGLGFFLQGRGDIPTPFGTLASTTTFGAIGAGSTVCWADPERGITFVCLTSGLQSSTASIPTLPETLGRHDIVTGLKRDICQTGASFTRTNQGWRAK